jgi:hypothetical protein
MRRKPPGAQRNGGRTQMNQLKLFETPQTAKTSDDYWTPRWIFDKLGLHFDIDVACPPEGPAHTPCSTYYTQADDGLSQEWHGLVFMNPPFSKTTPWVTKWLQHGNGIALLPFAKSKWLDHLWNKTDAIIPIPREYQVFVQGHIMLPCFLAAIGTTATQALHNSNIGKVR